MNRQLVVVALAVLAVLPLAACRRKPAPPPTATVDTSAIDTTATTPGGEFGNLTNTYKKTEAAAKDAVEKAKKAREREKAAE